MWCDASPRHQRALQDRGTPGSPEKPISWRMYFSTLDFFAFFSRRQRQRPTPRRPTRRCSQYFTGHVQAAALARRDLLVLVSSPPPPTYVFSLARVSTVRGGSRRACVCRRVIAVLLRVRRVNAGVWCVASSSGCAIGICPRGFGTVCVQWGTSPIPP